MCLCWQHHLLSEGAHSRSIQLGLQTLLTNLTQSRTGTVVSHELEYARRTQLQRVISYKLCISNAAITPSSFEQNMVSQSWRMSVSVPTGYNKYIELRQPEFARDSEQTPRPIEKYKGKSKISRQICRCSSLGEPSLLLVLEIAIDNVAGSIPRQDDLA